MMALLPPSSSSERPKRLATTSPTRRPIRVEPVADTSGMRRSFVSSSPTEGPSPMTSEKIAGSTPLARQTFSASLMQAMAVSGVFSEGFHTVASPHTAASALFHDQTATGKLNAEMMPTTPSGCHCSIIR
jgi:hypothetical protein